MEVAENLYGVTSLDTAAFLKVLKVKKVRDAPEILESQK